MHSKYHWTDNTVESASYDLKGLMSYLNPAKNKSIIDIGCGNGSISVFLMERGYNVFGVDASEEGIRIARSRVEDKQRFQVVDFDTGGGYILQEMDKRNFDTVISTQVIEHVYSPRSYMKLCHTLLPVGGMLFITTPYHGYIKNLVLALTGKMDAHFGALWEGGHIKFWSKKTLTQLLTQNGFQALAFKGLGRIPFLWKSMLLVAEKKANIER